MKTHSISLFFPYFPKDLVKIHLLAWFMGRYVKNIGVDNSIFSSKYLYSQTFTDWQVWGKGKRNFG